jgi:hypothetical protein
MRAPRATQARERRDPRGRHGPAEWFVLDRARAAWTRCAACRVHGVAARQPLEGVAFCPDCLERARPPRGREAEELGGSG